MTSGALSSTTEARADLIDALKRQKQGLALARAEKRFPKCSYEDMGVAVMAIPSRLFYAFENSVDGYHKQRQSSNLAAEGRLVSKHIDTHLTHLPANISIIDVGGGDGIRGLAVADAFALLGKTVNYTCYDGSAVMLDRSAKLFKSHSYKWRGIQGRFEDFKNTDLNEADDRHAKIIMFLGNNYGNYSPDDIAEILTHKDFYAHDAIIIGTDVPQDENDGVFYIKEMTKYSDDAMRMGVFSQLGFERKNLCDFMQFDAKNHQVEVFSVVLHDVAVPDSDLSFSAGNVFLANIARRPPANVLAKELSDFFEVSVIKDAEIDSNLALAVCTKKH
jgi:hypothetical protein